MYKQIGKLLKDSKELDKGFITDAFEIMVSHDHLEDFAKDITFNTEESRGSYDFKSGIININLEEPLNSQSINKKLRALQVLRHEIEHAKNFRKVGEGSKELEAAILGISYSVFSHKESQSEASVDLYEWPLVLLSNYAFDPDERIAEIRSFKFIVNLLKNKRDSMKLYIARVRLYEAYIRGYINNDFGLSVPTYIFLINNGLYKEYLALSKAFSKDNSYSLETRVLCGLPISKKEKEIDLVLKSGLKEY